MPRLRNFTVFPNLRYYNTDNRGREFGIVVVKATYEIKADGSLAIAEEQAPVVFTDLCHGAVNVSALWHPSDMVPRKPRGDLIVNAVAHAPGGRPARDWLCGVRVEGRTKRLERMLRVTGPRSWEPRWLRQLTEEQAADWRSHRKLFKGWVLSQPEPVTRVPVRYELAYGGLLPKGEDDAGRPVVDANHFNPIGRGWIDPEWTDHTRPVPAPQIEAVDRPVGDPYEVLLPQGLGPIPPAWLPRRTLGGTYDQHWKDHVWPNWPADYDFAYHNSANPGLLWPGFFDGVERITLLNLVEGAEEVRLRLPGSTIRADLLRPDGARDRRTMDLDTVFLDIGAPDPDDHRVFLCWRIQFEPDVFSEVALTRTAAKRKDTRTEVTE